MITMRNIRTCRDSRFPEGYSVLVAVEFDTWSSLQGRLRDVIENLQGLLDAVPEEYRDTVDFEITARNDVADVSVAYDRPATEREINIFRANQETTRERRRQQLLQELQFLEDGGVVG
jgi:hypothetical protein